MISTGVALPCVTAADTLPSIAEDTPESPREPSTMSWAPRWPATRRMSAPTDAVPRSESASASNPAASASATPSDASASLAAPAAPSIFPTASLTTSAGSATSPASAWSAIGRQTLTTSAERGAQSAPACLIAAAASSDPS